MTEGFLESMPATFPIPPLPNAVAAPSAPITGGAVKHELLKYPFRRLVTEPLITS